MEEERSDPVRALHCRWNRPSGASRCAAYSV